MTVCRTSDAAPVMYRSSPLSSSARPGPWSGLTAMQILNAGLPAPSMFKEIPVSSGDHSTFCRWAAESLRSVQHQLIDMGLFSETVAIERVEDSLRDATVAACGVLEGPTQVGAWARI